MRSQKASGFKDTHLPLSLFLCFVLQSSVFTSYSISFFRIPFWEHIRYAAPPEEIARANRPFVNSMAALSSMA